MNTTLDFSGASVETGVSAVFAHYPNGSMWTGNGNRDATKIIKFDDIFLGEPVVHISMAYCDCNQNYNLGYKMTVTNITAQDFEVTISIWSDAKFAAVSVNWMAIGKIA